MSIYWTKQVWEYSQVESGTQLLVLLAIASNLNETEIISLGIKTISELIRQSPRNTIRVIKALEENGELHVYRQNGYRNHYSLGVNGSERLEELVDLSKLNRDMSPRYYERVKKIDIKIREQVFERDNYQCLACGSLKNLVMDHVVPVHLYGKTKYSNLQTLCAKCNREKAATYIDYRKIR